LFIRVQLMMILPEGLVLTQATDMAKMTGQGAPPPPRGSGRMFNRPTDIAVHPVSGDLFISDGYGNNVIHHLRGDGSHVKTWGGPGTELGQFNTPHCVIIHPDLEHIIVCDRESNRLQTFDLGGNLTDWAFTMRPAAICADASGNFFVAQNKYGFQWTPNIGNRVSVIGNIEPAPKELTHFGHGAEQGVDEPDSFVALHALAVDSVGDVYAAEVSWINPEMGGSGLDPPREMRSLHKYKRVSG
jgi:hypothetical protein